MHSAINKLVHSIFFKIKNLSLKYKLFSILLFNCFIIFFCALSGYWLYIQTCQHLLFNAIADNLTATAYNLTERLENIEALSSSIISAPSIQEMLGDLESQRNPSVAMRSNYKRQLDNELSKYSTHQIGIDYISIYNRHFKNSTNWYLMQETNSNLLETALKNGQERQGAITWTYVSRNDNLCLSRNIRQIQNMSLKPIGDLIISVNMDKLVNDASEAFTLYEKQQHIIASSTDHLIYATNSLSNTDATHFLTTVTKPYQIVSHNGHPYFVVSGTLPRYKYKYLSLTPFDEISNSLLFALVTTLIFFIFGFIFIVYISNRLVCSISKQFDALINKMHTFSQNELILPDENNQYSNRADEVGALHRQFDLMAKRIHTLVKVNYVNELLTKDANLKALKSQISPHFLYNTLETINWRAKAVGNETISQIVESLGALLRASLSSQSPLTTLSHEMELVNSYMTIQKIRFEEQLDFQLIINDSELFNAVIPPFTIQPLVENAIHYGMEEMTDVCHIQIDVYREDSFLIIKVQNEGSNFEDNLLEKLKTNQIQPAGLGIGLANINQRIELLFGSEYGLSFLNEKNVAVAVIKIPYRTEEKSC